MKLQLLLVPAIGFGFDLALSNLTFGPIQQLLSSLGGSWPGAVNSAVLGSGALAVGNLILSRGHSIVDYASVASSCALVQLVGGPLIYAPLVARGVPGPIIGASMTAVGSLLGLGVAMLIKM